MISYNADIGNIALTLIGAGYIPVVPCAALLVTYVATSRKRLSSFEELRIARGSERKVEAVLEGYLRNSRSAQACMSMAVLFITI